MRFGGNWTTEKLKRVVDYLNAYTMALKNKSFCLHYIDAFAGTGYRTLDDVENPSQLMIPEMVKTAVREFLDGSARVALGVKPRFDKYIFIEEDKKRFSELQQLKVKFPEADVQLVRAEANSHIQELCNSDWLNLGQRAVLFLDPYGMEVKWQTIEAIADTKAIDLWILFPLGVAVNRLLRVNGQIDESIRKTLNEFFGTDDWFEEFYRKNEAPSLFENPYSLEKVANWDAIEHYFIERLESIFTQVAKKPLRLYNSRDIPLYLLCFASGNPTGAPIAVRIAQDILKR